MTDKELELLYQESDSPQGNGIDLDKLYNEGDALSPSVTTINKQSPLTLSEVGDIIKRNAFEAYRETFSPAIRGLGFGIPQAIAERIQPNQQIFPAPETMGGKGIELASGMIPASKIAGATSQAARMLPALAKQNLLNRAVAGGIGGAVAGAAYTPEQAFTDFSSNQQRVGQAAVGGILGSAGELGTGLATKGFREYNKFKARSATKLTTRIQWKKSDVGEAANQKLLDIKNENDKVVGVLKDNLEILTQQLDEASQTGSIDIQKQLPQFFKRNSNSYGARLDDIAEELASRPGGGFTYKDANKIIRDSIEEINGLGLPEGQAERYVGKLLAKYNPENVDLSKPINFKDFKNDIQGVWKQLSGQAKSGQGYAPEDIAGNILKKNFGEYAAEQIPEFAELQQAYRPVVEGMKLSKKLFKPLDDTGLNNINQASNMLKREATRKATPQEIKLLSMLRSGSEFGEGINYPTKQLKIGSKISSESKRLSDINKQTELDLNRVSEASKRRIAELEARFRRVSNLEDRKAVAQRVRNGILWTLGAGLGGTLFGGAVRASKEMQSIRGTQ